VVFQPPSELQDGELAVLVSVEEVRSAISGQRLLYRFEAEVGGQRSGETVFLSLVYRGLGVLQSATATPDSRLCQSRAVWNLEPCPLSGVSTESGVAQFAFHPKVI